MAEVQRSFHPSILEGQVTSAADIQVCLVTDSKQPLCDLRLFKFGCAAIAVGRVASQRGPPCLVGPPQVQGRRFGGAARTSAIAVNGPQPNRPAVKARGPVHRNQKKLSNGAADVSGSDLLPFMRCQSEQRLS